MKRRDYSEHIGKRFGRIVVQSVRKKQFKHQRTSAFTYKCDCGAIVETVVHNVLKGMTTQCHKCAANSAAKKRVKHGLTRTALYHWWRRIRESLCDEWQDLGAFCEAMRERSPGATIIAINPSEKIGPGNFRFENRNAARSKKFEFRGERRTVREIAKMLGITKQAVHNRIEGDRVREVSRNA